MCFCGCHKSQLMFLPSEQLKPTYFRSMAGDNSTTTIAEANHKNICRTQIFLILPLHADMRKYPHSVISRLKSKCTTGRVCPLHVNGICRRLAMVIVALFSLRCTGHFFYHQENLDVLFYFFFWSVCPSVSVCFVCCLSMQHRNTHRHNQIVRRNNLFLLFYLI